jgi:hypothetical protein
MPLPLPNPKDIRDLFADLLGRPITVSPGEPLLADDLKHALVSVYVDDGKRMAAVVGLDLALTIYAGAAIGLLPPGGAQDCVKDKEVTPTVGENVREVCNVLTAVLNRDGGPHVKLYNVAMPGEDAAADARAQLLALGNRLDLKVEVGGYGSGRIAVSLAP